MRRNINASEAEAGPSGAVASALPGEGALCPAPAPSPNATILRAVGFDVERIGALLPAAAARDSTRR